MSEKVIIKPKFGNKLFAENKVMIRAPRGKEELHSLEYYGDLEVKEKPAKDEKVKKDKGPRICSKCGSSVPKGNYFCKGMCGPCYSRSIYEKKHGKSHKEEKLKSYECIDCFKEFKSPLSIEEAKCPANPSHKLIQR